MRSVIVADGPHSGPRLARKPTSDHRQRCHPEERERRRILAWGGPLNGIPPRAKILRFAQDCAGKADGSWWVRVPPAQSLVDRAEPSLACAPVTAWTKRRQGPYGVRVVSLERERNAEAEAVPEAEGSMSCSSAPPARAMTLRRGQGPHHVWKASIGTQEARPGPSAGPRGGHVATLTPE